MIVFGSRGSDLALTQTRMVAEQVKARTGEDYRIEVLVTTGDRIQDRPLSGIGVKGLFTRELEDALRSGTIDAAVHSLKDLPVEDPDGIQLGCVPPREDPCDVVVTRAGVSSFIDLPVGSSLGTSSPRRSLAAATTRTDLTIRDIRGNVPTRVDKVRRGDYDAVLLAAAGLNRLQLELGELVRRPLSPSVFTPAPGQGALGIQCRRGDDRTLALLADVHDPVTASCVQAERSVLFGLGGGCSMPLGVLVDPVGDRYRVRAALFGGDPVAALRTAAIGDDPAALAQAIVAAWRPLVDRPLAGRRVAMVRPDGHRTGLAAAMAIAGADVAVLPATRTERLVVDRAALAHTLATDAIVCTSQRAVRPFVEACARHGLPPFERPVFAVGDATATEWILAGCEHVVIADGRGGESLAKTLRAHGIGAGHTVGMPCALERHGGFERTAGATGVSVRGLPVYRLEHEPAPCRVPADLDAFVFTSPSAVAAVLGDGREARPARAIAIGRTTAEALRDAGHPDVTTLPDPTAEALLDALLTDPT